MAEHMEDEEKIGESEDIIHSKEENMPKKPTNSELLKVYLEDLEEEKKEEWPEEEKEK